jgi:uncharacterized protein with HEPN domain
MPRAILLRLTDIRESIDGIAGVIADSSFERYAGDWGMQRAVERGLEIISEASRHVPQDLASHAPEIPWRQLAAIGNLLRHEYQRTDVRATWNIVKEHLPPLAAAIDRLIVEAEKQQKE